MENHTQFDSFSVFDHLVPGISGNLVVKSKLLPRSGSSLEAVKPIHKKGP